MSGETEKVSTAPASFSRLLGFLFFALGVVVPAWLLNGLLVDIVRVFEGKCAAEDIDNAKYFMTETIRGSDRVEIIRTSFRKWEDSARNFLRRRRLDPGSAGQLQKSLMQRFPRTSRFFWFDSAGNLVFPRGESPPQEGIRAWKGFQAFLSGSRKPSPGERYAAQALIRTRMGDLVDPKWLLGCRRGPMEVLFDGRLYLLSLTLFRFGKAPPVGSLVSLVPLFRARKGWEVERFLRAGKGSGVSLGAFWQSTGEGVKGGEISPGLQHGLLENLGKGRPVYETTDSVFLSRFWQTDPDLVLTVGIKRTGRGFLDPPALLTGLQGSLWLFVLAVGLLLAAPGGVGFFSKLSLVGKFSLGTVLLAGFPLIAMSTSTLRQSLKLHLSLRQEVENRLEREIGSIEKSLSDIFAEVEVELAKILGSFSLAHVRTPSDMDRVLGHFKPIGLIGQSLIFRDGKFILDTTLPRKQFSATISIAFSVLRQTLASLTFDVGAAEKALETPIQFHQSGLMSFAGWADSFLNRLHRLETGFQKRVVFPGLVRDSQGSVKSLACLVFSFETLAAESIKRKLGSLPPRNGLFIRAMFQGGTKAMPRHPFVRGILDVTEATRQPLCVQFDHKGEKYLVLCRPLGGMDAVAAAVMPAGRVQGFSQHAIPFLGILFFSSLSLAIGAGKLLRKFLLTPLLELTCGIGKVHAGDYEAGVPVRSQDELGILGASFNWMLVGLRQKARMASFLRPELIRQASSRPLASVSRERLGILFAGLRDFRNVEQGLSPELAVSLMNDFHLRCQEAIGRCGGEIDKMLGDAVMAVFQGEGSTALEAGISRAALELRESLRMWRENRIQLGLPAPAYGIGFGIGPVVAGHIGSEKKRMDFTVIGDIVNLAARLEKLAGTVDLPSVLGTIDVPEPKFPGIIVRDLPLRAIRGRTGPVRIFTLEEENGTGN